MERKRGYRLRRLEHRPPTGDPQRIVKRLLENKFNILTASATSGWGLPFYESKVRPMDQRCVNPNFIPTLIRLCHENNIEIWSWLPFNIQDVRDGFLDWPVAKLYPEYTMKFINPNEGEPDAIGMCIVSSPYIEEHAKFLREIASLGFDGFWFDGAKINGEPNQNRVGCVCEYCREAFHKDTDLDLPTRIDWTDRRFKEWVRWRYKRLVKVAEYFADELRRVNPKARVVMGTYYFPAGPGKWERDWKRGWPLEYFSKFGTHAHGMPYECAHGVGVHARIARAGNPEYTDIWTPIFALPPRGHYPAIPPHTTHMKLHGLCSILNGAVPWYGGQGEGMKEVNEALAQAEPYFCGDELKYVAVVVSDLTRDFWGTANDRAELYSGTLYGLYSILTQHQIQHSFIFNCHLEEGGLEEYSVILLPNTACLSDKACDNLKEWVRRGGLLITYYETSLYDEWGDKRDNFGLADLLGVDYSESSPVSQEIMRPTNLRLGAMDIMERRFAFCSPYTKIKVVADDVDVLASTDSGFKGEEEPVIVRRAFGAGEVLYSTDDIGLGYLWWPYESTRRILSNMISKRSAPYNVTAPTVVMANAFKKDGHLLIHLLNYPYATNRIVGRGLHLVVDELVPVHDIRISVNSPKVKSARTAISGKELEVSQSEGKCFVQLPPLKLYEIVEIDL